MGHEFGVLDQRFLARSLGTLNPDAAVTIAHNATLSEALQLLQEHRTGALVVLDDTEKVCGIFTERDVVLKALDVDRNNSRVAKFMTANPQTATMTTSVAFALNMLSHGGYRHIPIVDEQNYPLGLVSVKDIVDFIVRNLTRDLLAL